MRAAEQIATELEHLEGEELWERARRMHDLITTANQQQKAATKQQGPVASKSVRETAGANQPNAPPRQQRQASLPHGSLHRSRSNQGAAGGSRKDEPAGTTSNRRRQPGRQ